jgi:mRNA interferase MazF
MNPASGEVCLIDLGMVGKVRPAIAVSREDPDSPRAICIFVPITSECRGSRYEVSIGKPKFLREPQSWANTQALVTVGHEKIIRSLGRVTPEQLAAIKDALRFALDL